MYHVNKYSSKVPLELILKTNIATNKNYRETYVVVVGVFPDIRFCACITTSILRNTVSISRIFDRWTQTQSSRYTTVINIGLKRKLARVLLRFQEATPVSTSMQSYDVLKVILILGLNRSRAARCYAKDFILSAEHNRRFTTKNRPILIERKYFDDGVFVSQFYSGVFVSRASVKLFTTNLSHRRHHHIDFMLLNAYITETR